MLRPSDWAAISAAAAPAFSHDGRTLFHLRGTGLPQIWAMPLGGPGAARPLSEHAEKVAFLRRAPTDDRLIWGVDAGGDERQQLWLLEPGAARPRPLTADPRVIHDFGAVSPDGTEIAFSANDRNEACWDVLVMDLASGARRRLLEGPGERSVTAWSAVGDRLAVIGNRTTGDQSLLVINVAEDAVHEVPRTRPTRYAAARFSADGTRLLVLTDQGGEFLRLERIDPATGVAEALFAPPGRDVEAWSLSPGGALLATIENDRGYALLRVGAPTAERPVVGGLPPGIVADLAWSVDGNRLAFAAQGPTEPPGLWLWERESAAARPLWRPDPRAEAGIDPARLIAPALVTWRSTGGTAVPGWFAKPEVPPPAGGHPAVISVHGGPASQARADFRPDVQMLLDRGYAVLMPNVRGSTGYGRAWMEADDVGRRKVAIADLLAAHAWLAAQPGIAPGRIGVMGQSYGGWMVLAAVTLHPELWRAAVDWYGIADWFTLLRDTGPWRRDHRAAEYGLPGRDDAVLEALSPIRRVAEVTAPLLVAHGDRDPRVPIGESERFVAEMHAHGLPVRYERFEYAGHGFIRPEHRRRIFEVVAEHFDRHL
ncbi:MAG: S9 family peptidase [Rhodospirillales bacterium]|nr:S9 family peptidase [Rhodospirillales bacterium]